MLTEKEIIKELLQREEIPISVTYDDKGNPASVTVQLDDGSVVQFEAGQLHFSDKEGETITYPAANVKDLGGVETSALARAIITINTGKKDYTQKEIGELVDKIPKMGAEEIKDIFYEKGSAAAGYNEARRTGLKTVEGLKADLEEVRKRVSQLEAGQKTDETKSELEKLKELQKSMGELRAYALAELYDPELYITRTYYKNKYVRDSVKLVEALKNISILTDGKHIVDDWAPFFGVMPEKVRKHAKERLDELFGKEEKKPVRREFRLIKK